MDEWMVSILLGAWNGGGVCCCCPAQCVGWLVPYSSHRSVDEYCCHVAYCSLPGVWRVVVGVCLCCSCGGVSSVRSPLVVVEGGAIVDGRVP